MKQELLAKIEEATLAHLRSMADDIIKKAFRATNKSVLLKEGQYSFFCDGVKFFYTKGNRSVVVLETPPGLRTITLNEIRYNLSFPYVYICVVFEEENFVNAYCTFSNKKIKNGKEEVLIPCLPNIEALSLRICTGEIKFKTQDIFENSSLVRDCFWGYAFKLNEWDENYASSMISLFKGTIKEWEKKSNKDPLAALKIKWLPLGETHLEFISKILSVDNGVVRSLKNDLYKDIVHYHTNALISNLGQVLENS